MRGVKDSKETGGNSMRFMLLAGCALLAACGGASPEEATDAQVLTEEANYGQSDTAVSSDAAKLWVTTKRVERRTCPSENCGSVGYFMFREAVTVLERKGDWGRVTKRYSAACEGGKSRYVETGVAACTSENGIEGGEFAEWVQLASVATQRPADPADTASRFESLVSQSDDFAEHRAAFVKAAQSLIADQRCSAADFEEIGGWLKSSNHRDEPIYFTYCGGMTVANRIYLDASSGRIFKE